VKLFDALQLELTSQYGAPGETGGGNHPKIPHNGVFRFAIWRLKRKLLFLAVARELPYQISIGSDSIDYESRRLVKRPLSVRESCRQPAEVAQTAGLNCLFFVTAIASTATSLLDHLAALLPLVRTVFGRSLQQAAESAEVSTPMLGSESAS
jgi:hypothetical protein